MNSPAGRTESDASKLQAALLEYFAAPGKYQLSLRQPALLFSSIREILQLAAGRSAGGGEQAANRAVMDAAAFFIRAALLHPGASHYAVMGLPARAEPVELKERYRLLMRLMHPDFAAAHVQSWPADAAVRVNRANEVLSSPVLRAEYDEQLAGAAPQRPQVAARMDVHVPAPELAAETASLRFNRAAVWALAGCGILVVGASLVPWQGPDQLVQKGEPPISMSVSVEHQRALQLPRAEAIALANVPAEPPLALPPMPAPAVRTAQAPAPAPLPGPAPVRAAAPVPVPAPGYLPAPARAVAAAQLPAPRAEPPIQLRASASVPAFRPEPVPAPVRSAQSSVPAPAEAPRLAVTTQPAPQEPPLPAPERRAEAVAAPAAVAPPAPVAVALAREEPARPVPARQQPVRGPNGTEPSLTDAQPLLTQLLQSMEGGSGEQILRLLEGDARRAPSALALSRQYDQLVGRGRPVRLSHVEFRSEAREGVLLVTGLVRLQAGDPTIGAHGERMSLRAEFVSRGGRVLLTGLGTGSD